MREERYRLAITIACALAVCLCLAALASSGEKKVWQAGTILSVKDHQPQDEDGDRPKKYDISVKVGKKIYVVLYAPEKELPGPEFYVGMARTVLVEGDVLKFNDLQGNTHTLRILSSKDAPPESK